MRPDHELCSPHILKEIQKSYVLTQEEQDKHQKIVSIISKSEPIQGTVAEKYLQSRGTDLTESDDLRFLKRVNTGAQNNEKRPFASALLGIVRDEKGEVKAIQMTYLDPVSGKKIDELPIKKRSMGSLKGGSVMLAKSESVAQLCFISEGIETGLSVQQALKTMKNGHSEVMATLGISNFSDVAALTKAQNIVLVLDNDGAGAQSQKLIDKAIVKLQESGKMVHTMKPEMLDGKKTDFNDLLKAGKLDAIIQEIEPLIERSSPKKEAIEPIKTDQGKVKLSPEKEKMISTDREMFG